MPKRKKADPPNSKELAAHIEILDSCDERAAAVMAAAWVDDSLSALLRVYLARDGARSEKLLNFSGALGTFSARIDVAYLLGLISSRVEKDLTKIREIRNDFAHIRTSVSFDSQSISDRCKDFQVISEFEAAGARATTSPKGRFVLACCLLSFGLLAQAGSCTPPDKVESEPLKYAAATGTMNRDPFR